MDVRGLPQDSRTDFRSRIVTLKKFCEKLVLLEHVRLRLSCDMHVKSIMEEPSTLIPKQCCSLAHSLGPGTRWVWWSRKTTPISTFSATRRQVPDQILGQIGKFEPASGGANSLRMCSRHRLHIFQHIRKFALKKWKPVDPASCFEGN